MLIYISCTARKLDILGKESPWNFVYIIVPYLMIRTVSKYRYFADDVTLSTSVVAASIVINNSSPHLVFGSRNRLFLLLNDNSVYSKAKIYFNSVGPLVRVSHLKKNCI